MCKSPGDDWVEWSATGLKDASIFDLSPTGTKTQIRSSAEDFQGSLAFFDDETELTAVCQVVLGPILGPR